MKDQAGFKKRGARRVPLWRVFAVILIAVDAGLAAPVAARADEFAPPQKAAAQHTGDFIPYEKPKPVLTAVDASAEASALTAQYDQDTSDEAFKATILTALARRDTNEVKNLFAFQKTYAEANNLYQELLVEHPELFDVDTTFVGTYDQNTRYLLTFTPKYYLSNRYTDDQVLAMRDKMSQGIADAMSWIPADGTTLEKVKAAHDWMCTHVTYYYGDYTQVGEYDIEPATYGLMQDYYDVFYAHCAYGAFGEGSCVCQGFANAYKLLMDKLGVPCETIQSEEHEWNAVQIDGAWYALDTTWDADNTSKVDADGNWDKERNQIAYTFFMMSEDEMIRRDHEYGGWGEDSKYHNPIMLQQKCEGTMYDGCVVGPYSSWYQQEPVLLRVQPQNMVMSFAFNNITLSLVPGDSSKLLPTIPNPPNANLLMATWTTSNPDAALVLGDGTVLAVAEGQATITCTMRGVTQTCAVTVGPDTRPQSIEGAVIADVEDQEYTGYEITPTPTVMLGDVMLTKGVDYELSYDNNVDEGQATITVTGIGGFYGTVTSTFNIIVTPELPKIEFATAQLILGEQIVMRFGLSVPEGINANDGQAVFTIGGKSARTSDPMPLSEADTSEETGTRGFYFELSSIEMAEPVICTFTYGGGEPVTLTSSVADYVRSLDKYNEEHIGEIDNNMLNCVHSVANYGHYVQPFLAQYSLRPWRLGTDYKEMTMCYADMNNVDEATKNSSSFKATRVGAGEDDLAVTCSLSLDSYITFDVFLAAKKEGDPLTAPNVKFDVMSDRAEVKLLNDGRYRVRVVGIKAFQLNTDLEIKGSVGGEPYTLYLSPLCYANVVLNGNNYDTLHKEAVTALYNYYYWSKKVY